MVVDPPASWDLPSVPISIQEILKTLYDYFEHGRPLIPIEPHRLDMNGWSEFQKQVYLALLGIPHGETRTYAWVAHKMGKLEATRAVGQALRRNPIPIVIPCHRVVAQHALGGFMGITDPNEPELKLKSFLIANEHGYLNPTFSFL